jgi:hypothetical protein
MIEIMFIDQPSDWNNLYNMTNMTTRCCWSEFAFFNQLLKGDNKKPYTFFKRILRLHMIQ